MPDKALISIVDDDEFVRKAITRLMKSLGYKAKAFPSAVDFLASADVPNTSCLVADVQMPQMTGVELYRRLLESGYAIPTILITAYADDGTRARVLKEGVICYLSKPFDKNALLGCVRTALECPRPDEEHS